MTAYSDRLVIDHNDSGAEELDDIFYCDQNFSELTCIWLDEHLTSPPTQALTNLISPFKWEFLSDFTQSLDYFNLNTKPSSITTLLIASGSLGRRVLPLIDYLDQFDAIFIYCTDVERNIRWTKNYPKILNVLNEPKQLQYELVNFVVKYYKHAGERTNDKQLAHTYFMKAIDILRQYGDSEDVETQQLINEFETTYVSEQYRKYKSKSILIHLDLV